MKFFIPLGLFGLALQIFADTLTLFQGLFAGTPSLPNSENHSSGLEE
jgi:hypothetical protein